MLRASFRYLPAVVLSIAIANAGGCTGRIIALAGAVNGRVAMLDDCGQIKAVPTSAQSLTGAQKIGQLPSAITPVDLVFFSAEGADYAAVTGIQRFGGSELGALGLFNATPGAKPQILRHRGAFTGVVYDPPQRRLLLAEARDPSVLESAPIPSGAPKFHHLRTLRRLKTIGPVALDNAARRLYCADPVEGVLYALDLATSAYALVVQQIGEASALCLNPQRTLLYVADVARRRIWAVRLTPPFQVNRFAAGVNLREPTGLAMDAQGRLWVADADSGRIHILTPNGQLSQTLQ